MIPFIENSRIFERTMRIQRATKVNELLARLIFLLLPTLLVGYFILWNANQYYSILHQQYIHQTIYLGIGMVGAALFYSFRFRFLPTFLALVLLFYGVYRGIDASAIGEFDAFFVSVQFMVFAVLTLLGWLIGWGFIRLRFFSIFLSALFLIACILLIARQTALLEASNDEQMLLNWLAMFGPVVLYAVYIIFTAELIRNYRDKSQKFWWYLTRRLVLFIALSALIFGGVVYFMRTDIKEKLAANGGGGKSGNSLLKKNKDGTFDLQDRARLRGNLSRSNDLLFAAYINNFFPDSEVPNPLYLTAFYYSRFDTFTETFEQDTLLPANDLFNPDLTKIPLYFTKQDSTVLDYALKENFRETVEIEVYKKSLSPSTFVAPSTSFFVQPIAIEKDYRQEFRSAYRAKSYVSELNSAYFVYNAPDPIVRKFQEQRFQVLRQVKDYRNVDTTLMRYYTFMPQDEKFNRIRRLTDSITQDASTPIDKIIAVRDYFLSKDENGEPLFQYSDNPGIPDIPNASKLFYFLFENRKGYCAYYAGATLFMLRSLGIPSRITVGFLTEERGSTIPGWYWFYADQAHAWVQVYFPGFGWLDFDTTVGNDDARQSPQPDGTPPMQPPKAYLAVNGVITAIDSAKQSAQLKAVHVLFHDQEYPATQQPVNINMDLSVAVIVADSMDIALKDVRIGDSATAISFAETYRNKKPIAGESAERLMQRLPNPSLIDELHLKVLHKENNIQQPELEQQAQQFNWKVFGFTIVWAIFALTLLFLLLPRIIYAQYQFRRALSGSKQKKAYWTYRITLFWLHMMGYPRSDRTPLQHAEYTDQNFGTTFAQFMIPYLKMKYAKQPLNTTEEKILLNFLPGFLQTVRSHIPVGKRFTAWLHIIRAISFFQIQEEEI
jgi:hypothetical protein